MKSLPSVKRLAASALLAVLATSSAASAGVDGSVIFGSLQSARTIGDEQYSFGVGALTGDNLRTLQGDFAYGFGRFTEGRLRLGVSDIDGPGTDPTVALGAEFKYQFWNFEGGTQLDDPIDLSFSGMLEYASFDFVSITSVGANVIGSRPFISKQGRRYGPYGRFNVRLQTADPKGIATSNTDINFTLTPGFMVQLTDQMTALAELNLDDDLSLAFGFSFGPF